MSGFPEPLRRLLQTTSHEEQLFANLALRHGVIDARTLHQALQEHVRLRNAGQPASLGQILVRHRIISTQQFTALWNEARRISNVDNRHVSSASSEGHQSTVRRGGAKKLTEGLFGRYRIVREIARGGMGVVYEAMSPENERVALKVMLSEAPGETALARFKREVMATRVLDHPNIVRTLDAGNVEGKNYFTMEYVEGRPLDAYLEEEAPDFETRLLLFRDILLGLQHAHDKGVIHRDMKPENVLVTEEGVPRITDFGLAKTGDAEQLTRTGAVMGTPFYMSPEQASGMTKHVDHRGDLFSVGTMMYEAFTGKLPYQGKNPVQLYGEILEKDPPPPSELNEELPTELDDIIARAHQKNTEWRYPTAREMAGDIEQLLSGRGVRVKGVGLATRMVHAFSQRWKFYVGVTAAVLAVGIGGFLTFRYVQRVQREARQTAAVDRLKSTHASLIEARDLALRALQDERWEEVLEPAMKGIEAVRELRTDEHDDAPDPDALEALVDGYDLASLLGTLQHARGKALGRLGDVAAAAEAYGKAIETGTGPSGWWVERASLCVRGEDYERGRTVCREGIDEGVAVEELALLLGTCLERLGQWKEAAAHYGEWAEKGEAKKALFYCRLARVAVQRGEERKARDHLNRVRSLDRERNLVEPLLIRAELAARAGEDALAFGYLERAGRKFQKEPRVHGARARLHRRRGHLLAAREDLGRAMEGEDCPPSFYRRAVELDFLRGNETEVPEQLVAFKKAIGGRHPAGPTLEARLARWRGELDEARRLYDTALALRSDYNRARRGRLEVRLEQDETVGEEDLFGGQLLRGRVLLALDQLGKAVEALEGDGEDGRQPFLHRLRNRAHRRLGNLEVAKEAAAEARRAEEDVSHGLGALLWRARRYVAGAEMGIKEDVQRAEAVLDRLLTMEPRLYYARCERTRLRLLEKKADEAVAQATQAIDLDPVPALAYRLRGAAHLRADSPETAVGDFQKALERDGGTAETIRGLVEAQLGAGEAGAALAFLEDRLAGAPKNHDLLSLAVRAARDAAPDRVAEYEKRADEVTPKKRHKKARKMSQKAYRARNRGEPYRPLYDKAIALAPDHYYPYESFGRTLFNDFELVEGAQQFARYFTMRSRWMVHLVIDFNKIKKYHPMGEVMAALDEKVEASPEDPIPHIARAWFLYWMNRDGRSVSSKQADAMTVVKDMDLALRHHPTAPLFYLFRGAMWHQLNYPRAARRDVDRALELAPKSKAILYVAAEVMAFTGQSDRAVELLLEARKAGLELDPYLRSMKVFESIRDDPRLIKG